MDNFLILLLMLVVYLFAGVFGNKKKRRKAPPQRMAAQDARPRQRRTSQGKAHADCREQTQMHLHEVTQEKMHEAMEGEDPCHAGGTRTAEEEQDFAAQTDEQQQALAQDVLRGVIMSEILTRPCERRTTYGNRRNR